MDARVVQHELDHLDGVLMLERTDDESRREALATLRRTILVSLRGVKLVVAATAPFGADVLERLAARHDVAALLTRPDRPRGAAASSPRRRPSWPPNGSGSPCSSPTGRPPSSSSRPTRSSSSRTAC